MLRSSYVLQRFLRDEDVQSFNNFKKTASKIQPPLHLSGFLSEDGVLRLDSQREDLYVRNLGIYLDNTQILTDELKQQSKALIQALTGLGNVLAKMYETCSKLEAVQSVLPNLQTNAVLFSAVGSALHNWAQAEYEQAMMVNESFVQYLTYASADTKPLKDLLAKRNEQLANYMKADAKLTPKKDKLWFAGDTLRWELGPDDRQIPPNTLLADKFLAYSKMLPNETSNVSQLHDRFAYYNARLKVESERVLWENALINNKHFATYASKEADHTTHLHIQWAQTIAQLAIANHEALEILPVVVA